MNKIRIISSSKKILGIVSVKKNLHLCIKPSYWRYLFIYSDFLYFSKIVIFLFKSYTVVNHYNSGWSINLENPSRTWISESHENVYTFDSVTPFLNNICKLSLTKPFLPVWEFDLWLTLFLGSPIKADCQLLLLGTVAYKVKCLLAGNCIWIGRGYEHPMGPRTWASQSTVALVLDTFLTRSQQSY